MSRPRLLSCRNAALALALCFFGSVARAQQQPVAGSRYDVTNYRIEVQLSPNEHLLRAGADVTFTPQEPTRSIVFELNGSLHVDSIEKDGRPLTGFVQDVAEGTADLDGKVWEFTFRSSCMRSLLHNIADAARVSDYGKMMVETADAYEELIDDPLLIAVRSKFEQIGALGKWRGIGHEIPRHQWFQLLYEFANSGPWNV